MSATKEGVELIKRKLAAGAVCSLVKVGCRGVVLVLVQHAQQKQQAKEQQKQQPQEQQEQQEQQPQQQQEQQQEQHGQQQEQQEQQQEQQEQQQEQQEQQQQQQLQTEGEEGEQKQPEKKDRQQLQSGEATDDAQQHKHERDAAAGGLINMVDVAASILADVESGATPHARSVGSCGSAQPLQGRGQGESSHPGGSFWTTPRRADAVAQTTAKHGAVRAQAAPLSSFPSVWVNVRAGLCSASFPHNARAPLRQARCALQQRRSAESTWRRATSQRVRRLTLQVGGRPCSW
jgi:DNA polymerase III gamma/tau subunit